MNGLILFQTPKGKGKKKGMWLVTFNTMKSSIGTFNNYNIVRKLNEWERINVYGNKW